MDSILTDIPESIIPDTLIKTGDNVGISCVEFLNPDLTYESSQQEQYDWRYATLDCFKGEFYDDSDGYNGIFTEGYNTEEEAIAGHDRIVKDILAKGQAAECLQS